MPAQQWWVCVYDLAHQVCTQELVCHFSSVNAFPLCSSVSPWKEQHQKDASLPIQLTGQRPVELRLIQALVSIQTTQTYQVQMLHCEPQAYCKAARVTMFVFLSVLLPASKTERLKTVNTKALIAVSLISCSYNIHSAKPHSLDICIQNWQVLFFSVF